MTGLTKHKDICAELLNLYERKNHDYGNSFHDIFVEEGCAAIRIRLGDKLNRLKTLTKSDSAQVNDESIRDTLLDMANYAIMSIMELDGYDIIDKTKGTIRYSTEDVMYTGANTSTAIPLESRS